MLKAFVFILIVSFSICEKYNSSGYLAEDWKKFQNMSFTEEGIIETFISQAPQDVVEVVKSFYHSKVIEYSRRIRLELLYTQYNTIMSLMNTTIKNNMTNKNLECNNSTVLNDIIASPQWQNIQSNLNNEYQKDLNGFINEAKDLLKITIYHEDDQFYETYENGFEGNISKLVNQFAPNVLASQVKTKSNEVLKDTFNEIATQSCDNADYENENKENKDNFNKTDVFKDFSSVELVRWALFFPLTCTNKTSCEEELLKPDKVDLMLAPESIINNSLSWNENSFLCSMPFTKSMLNETEMNFTFDEKYCKNLETNETYCFAIKKTFYGFTTYTNKVIYSNVCINYISNQTVGNNVIKDAEIENGKCTIPYEPKLENGNSYDILFSFDNEDFQKSSFKSGSIIRKVGSNNLKLVIYNDSSIIFAMKNCIYKGNSTGILYNDWMNFLEKIGNNTIDFTNPDEILNAYKNYIPSDIKEVVLTVYNEKRDYFLKLLEVDMQTNLYDDIVKLIDQYYSREIKKGKVNCIGNLTDELFVPINNTIFTKYETLINSLLPEGKTLLKNKIYYNDLQFDQTYQTLNTENKLEIGAQLLINKKIGEHVNETLIKCMNSDNSEYKSISNQKCAEANDTVNHAQNVIQVEEETCFTPLQTQILNWTNTLNFKINEQYKKDTHCDLSNNAVFFLSSSLSYPSENNVLCEVKMKQHMLERDILSINFKEDNTCAQFPYPGINTYYFGVKAQIKNITTYQQPFIFNNAEYTYIKSNSIGNPKNVFKDHTADKCVLSNDITLSDSFSSNANKVYIEHSFDNKTFDFEEMNTQSHIFDEKNTKVGIVIYQDNQIIFADPNCEYTFDIQSQCINGVYENGVCVCNANFYGAICDKAVTNKTADTFMSDLNSFLSDDQFIISVNKDPNVKITNEKKRTLNNLLELTSFLRKQPDNDSTIQNITNITQINTLNSLTENYLTNADYGENSKYLLALALNCNILKLKRKRQSKLRGLQEMSESEEMIKHKIEHLLHLGAVHYANKNLSDLPNSESLELLDDNVYIHQWTDESDWSLAKENAKEKELTFIEKQLNCTSPSNELLEYTIVEIPRSIVEEIYQDNMTSNIISFYLKTSSSCSNAEFIFPADNETFKVNSELTIDGKEKVNLYDSNHKFFTDRCYRGDFDFDLTEKIKTEILGDSNVVNSLSKDCFIDNYEEVKKEVHLICNTEDMDSLIGFRVQKYSNGTDVGSIFECSSDIQDIEKNIAFWIYLIVLILTILGITFYLILKYTSANSDTLMKIDSALQFDKIDLMSMARIVQGNEDVEIERNRPIESNENLNIEHNIQNTNNNIVQSNDIPSSFGAIFAHNVKELHPIVNIFFPSVITPLSLRLAFFSFNLLTLFGFNAVFFTNDYLYDRYKDEDREKFVYPMKEQFDKLISAIVCTMGVAVLMRSIVMVSYESFMHLKESVQKRLDKKVEMVKEFRKLMLVRRCVCVFVMMVICGWFFYFSLAWCNRYPKAQHGWGDGCGWCLMFDYILFAFVYILIISLVEGRPGCGVCAYYMKRTFMF